MSGNQFLRIRFSACLFSSVLVLWAFVGTIDGPVVRLESNVGHLIYQTPKIQSAEQAELSSPLRNEIVRKDPPPLHPSFLLFDLKQDLRRWPNVANDISRSPPFLPAI
jgi:hypothetical protein